MLLVPKGLLEALELEEAVPWALLCVVRVEGEEDGESAGEGEGVGEGGGEAVVVSEGLRLSVAAAVEVPDEEAVAEAEAYALELGKLECEEEEVGAVLWETLALRVEEAVAPPERVARFVRVAELLFCELGDGLELGHFDTEGLPDGQGEALALLLALAEKVGKEAVGEKDA